MNWIAKTQMPGKAAFWIGTFQADGRENAKREARLFVAKHLPLDAKIVCIAQGEVTVNIQGPEVAM